MNPATATNDAAILAHQTLQRLASQSAACKLWSAALVTGVLAWMHSSRIGNDSMLWAVAPVLVLLLADAAYMTQSARLLAKLRQSKKPGVEELLQAHAPLSGPNTLGGLTGLFSSSVWPFYFALACAFFIAGHETARPSLPPPSGPGSSSLNRLSNASSSQPPGVLAPVSQGPASIAPQSGPSPIQLRPTPNAPLSPTSSARPKSLPNATSPRSFTPPASIPPASAPKSSPSTTRPAAATSSTPAPSNVAPTPPSAPASTTPPAPPAK